MEGSTNAAGSRRAGQYASERYHRGLRNYRRRFYRHVLWAIALVAIVELLIALYVSTTFGWMTFAFMLGVFFTGVWLIRDIPPDHIRRWGDGAWGEQHTAKALLPLEQDGWEVQHDIELDRGNIDHVAQSPNGRRFVLETKTLQGRLSVDDGFLTSTQLDDPEQVYRHTTLRHVVLERARGQYRENKRGWVQAIVVIWGDFPQRCVEDGKLVFLHGEELASWLRKQAS